MNRYDCVMVKANPKGEWVEYRVVEEELVSLRKFLALKSTEEQRRENEELRKEVARLQAEVRSLQRQNDWLNDTFRQNTATPPQFAGGCMGVQLADRSSKDPHQMFKIYVEDDETWHLKMSASTAWLDELIAKLQEARAKLDSTCTKGRYGYTRHA